MVNVAQIYKLQHGSDACYDEGGSGSIDRVPDQLPPLLSLVRGCAVVGVGSKVSEPLEDVVGHHIHPEEGVEEKELEKNLIRILLEPDFVFFFHSIFQTILDLPTIGSGNQTEKEPLGPKPSEIPRV